MQQKVMVMKHHKIGGFYRCWTKMASFVKNIWQDPYWRKTIHVQELPKTYITLIVVIRWSYLSCIASYIQDISQKTQHSTVHTTFSLLHTSNFTSKLKAGKLNLKKHHQMSKRKSEKRTTQAKQENGAEYLCSSVSRTLLSNSGFLQAVPAGTPTIKQTHSNA